MLNQYTAINAATPSYDDDGNMLTTGSGWTLGWDGENRLITASNANTVITNTYDSRSRRIRKQVAAYNSTSDLWLPTSDLRYFYDGWSLLHEHDVITSTPVTHYLWGLDLSGTLQCAGGVGGLLAEIRSGQVAASAADANGNITEYVNGSTGDLSARYAYDGFGITIATSGPSAASFSHRFSSKHLDAELGWYYYGFRFYAPEIGRWPNRDPIAESGGLNIFLFCNNAPNRLVDYFGLATTVEQLPDILDGPQSVYNYKIAGKFMRRFLDNPKASWETTKPDINTITINMLLEYPRAKIDYDLIFSEQRYTDADAKGVILEILKVDNVQPGQRFGKAAPLPIGEYPEKYLVHNTGSIAFKGNYGSRGGDGDDLGAAIGQFDWRVAISGIRKGDTSGSVCVSIDQVHIWMRDAYKFEKDGIDLGYWDASRPGYWTTRSHNWDATLINNNSFIEYTQRTQKGEEFSIFSDLKTITLPAPLILKIPKNYKPPPPKPPPSGSPYGY